jgi:hypothetical protein
MTADYSRSPVRLVLAVLTAAAVAAVGGVILGEYPFTGVMPYASGVLFALVVSEVIISIGHRRGFLVALAASLCTVGGLAWAVWISSGRGVAPVPTGGWMALVIGAVVAVVRGTVRGGTRSAGRTPGST